ncbi:hypothetical protein, partial [Salmonella enterica]|uniref:hypothetical protein n=1 Tax=Salmonella enterica TaxID=28901 RepID=UPI00398C6460
INENAPPIVVLLMVAAHLPAFAPSFHCAAEFFFLNVNPRCIRRPLIHHLSQRPHPPCRT